MSEINLQMSLMEQKTTIETSQTNISFLDKNLKIIWANKSAAESVNISTHKLAGHTCHYFWGNPAMPCENCPSLKALESGKAEQATIFKPDGRVWNERADPIFDEDRNLIGISVVASNITDHAGRVSSTKEIPHDSIRTLENISVGFLLLNKEWQIINMNNVSGEIFEVNPSNCIDKQIWTEFPKGFSHAFRIDYEKAMEGQKPVELEKYCPTFEKWFQHKIFPSKEGLSIFIQDVTAKKNIEIALRESEERYQKLTEISPIGIFRTNAEGYSTYVNPSYCRITGLSPHEAMGNGWLSAVHPDDRKKVEKSWKKSSSSHNYSSSEFRFVRADGSVAWVIGNAAPEINSENKINGYVGTITDITVHKQAEEEIRKSDEQYRIIAEKTTDIIWLMNLEGKSLYVTSSIENFTGFSVEEYMNQSIDERFTPESAIIAKNKLSKAILESKSNLNQNKVYAVELELEYKCKDGTTKWGELRCTPYIENQINFMGIHGVTRDITKRKKAEQAIQFSERRYRDIFNLAPVGIYQSTREGRFITSNDQLAKILGYDSVDELMNLYMDTDIYYDNTERESLITKFETFGTAVNYEVRWKKKDGTPLWIGISTYSVKDDNGKTLFFEGFVKDITESKKAVMEIIKAKEKAEESERLKTAFLQNMSHEIRTPLNAIMGFSELLTDNFNNKETLSKFTSIIKQRGSDLLEIIDEILDIAKIESGVLADNIGICNLNYLLTEIESLIAEYQKRQNKEHIRLIVNKQISNSDFELILDQGKLKQILLNLIKNAVKFTNSGKIEIGCYLKDTTNLVFYVSDTGIGIPEEHHELIFERFRQVNEFTYHEGTGLGLSICKGLIQHLGGEIWFTSELNKGTEFYFTIPFAKKQKLKDPIQEPNINGVNLINRNIIIAEDDFVSFLYLQELLKCYNVNIIHAENGQILMDLLVTNLPDLIFLDIKMPLKSGYECLKEIRSKNIKTKIICQTAYAMTIEREKCYEAGCNGYISKPILKDELYRVISEVFPELSNKAT
jgi:PAS domain S-box-containing protein